MKVAQRKIGYPDYQSLLDCFSAMILETCDEQVISIVLYGSVARGDAGPESDVDILLIMKEASPVYRQRLQPLIALMRQLRQQPCWKALEARELAPSLSVLILSKEEAEQNRYLYLDMTDGARILFDRDAFFHMRLDTVRMRLRELGARKVRRDATWYWDLKPDLQPGEVVTL